MSNKPFKQTQQPQRKPPSSVCITIPVGIFIPEQRSLTKSLNQQEYEEKLRKLSPNELKKFNDDYGGGQLSVEERVRNFVDEIQNEPRICQLLGVKTESQKITDATVNSADAAMKSASSAKVSMICSIFACLAAIVAALVAVCNLLTNKSS